MSIIILSQGKDLSHWINALKAERPELDLRIYPDSKAKEEVEFALAWNHPIGAFREFPNLRCISSMGAGVDHILKDPNLPGAATITRLVDTHMAQDMAEFAAALVLSHMRGLSSYKAAELNQSWKKKPYLTIADVTVGIMGMGHLGTYVSNYLTRLGFKVNGWARSAKNLDEVKVYVGEEELHSFLAASNILICLLPLTEETENILNENTFSQLPPNAYVINLARGAHLVDEDLVRMIDSGHLAGASLDVFREEPLPPAHPFWNHPKIAVTPHIASITKPESVVSQILENYDRLRRGEPLINTVSLERGY